MYAVANKQNLFKNVRVRCADLKCADVQMKR